MQIMHFIVLSMLPIMLLGSNCDSVEYYEGNIQNNQIKPDDICNKKLKLSNIKKGLACTFYTEPKQDCKIDVNRSFKGNETNNYKITLASNNNKFVLNNEFINIEEELQAVCNGIKNHYFRKKLSSVSDEVIKNSTEAGIIEDNEQYYLGYYTKLPKQNMNILTFIWNGIETVSYQVQVDDISPKIFQTDNAPQMLTNINDIKQYLSLPVNFLVDDKEVGITNEVVTCYSTPKKFFNGKSSNGTSFQVNRVLGGGEDDRTKNVNNKVKITIRDNKFTVDDTEVNKFNYNIGVILYKGEAYLGLYLTEKNIKYGINNEQYTDGSKTCWGCLDGDDDLCEINSKKENDLSKSTIKENDLSKSTIKENDLSKSTIFFNKDY